jgi:DNA-directed RNA polymerase-3 subunit RPC5
MDDGPPPDPDEPVAPPISSSPKKEKKVAEAKEAQVSTRKVEDKGNMQYMQGGLSAVRREMLMAMRNEEDEKWEDLEFYDGKVCVLRVP